MYNAQKQAEGSTMGKVYEALTEELQTFIRAQHMFFVATAPLSAEGHVNLSPKGLDSFRILSPNRVAYLDLTGSGNETSAHLYENGRLTFMFCAFDGPPQILRLYGTGRTLLPNDQEWAETLAYFPTYPGIRQIILADITRVYTSCGYAVPLLNYAGERDTWTRWAETKGEDALVTYRQEKNSFSIDALPSALAVQEGS
jgi:hypothetical protein